MAFNDDLLASVDRVNDETGVETHTSIMLSLSVIGIATLGIIGLAVFLMRSGVSAPLTRLIGTMQAMQGGDFAVRVDGTDRRDEVGSLAKGLEAFRVSLEAAERARSEREAAAEAEASAIRRRSALAERFVGRMEELASGFAKSSSEVADSARNLSATAEETSRQAQAVAGAAEEASTNVQTVASGTRNSRLPYARSPRRSRRRRRSLPKRRRRRRRAPQTSSPWRRRLSRSARSSTSYRTSPPRRTSWR